MQQVRLEGYRALVPGVGYLRLGNWDSYGIETLQILPGEDWQDLELTATFVTPAGATRVRVPETGLLPVPPEATAAPLGTGTPGRLVFAGMAQGVQRLSTDVLFLVSDHAAAEGAQSQPTPSLWAQYFDKIQGMIDAAVPPDGESGTVLTKTPAGNAWQRGVLYHRGGAFAGRGHQHPVGGCGRQPPAGQHPPRYLGRRLHHGGQH